MLDVRWMREELFMKIEKTMPPVPVLMINGCISRIYGRRGLIKTMP